MWIGMVRPAHVGFGIDKGHAGPWSPRVVPSHVDLRGSSAV